jgi:hypothetical protein
MLRGVLDRAAGRIGVTRGTREHEELAVRLLQLADIIPERERLVEALSQSASSRNSPQAGPPIPASPATGSRTPL